MTPNLKPYSAYKDSGVPWLGEVPAHWELQRTKTLLRERVQKGFPDEPLLAATQSKGVVRKEQYENRTVLALKDLHLLKLVRVGDFVISLRSFQGGIEYAREQGIISPAYTILYPRDSELHGYLAWLFKSKPYIENLALHVTGIREGQNIDYTKLARSHLPLPPSNEQTAIVRYLSYIDQRIRRYIRAKQKLIKLLEEQKQALIQRAVTGQIDARSGQPYPAYKDSGVAWLGEVPGHWEIWQIGHFAIVGNGSTPSRSNLSYWTNGTYPWLNSSSVNMTTIAQAEQFVTETALRECHLPKVPAQSVLIAITGQGKTRGTAAVLTFEATINQHLVFITPRRNRSKTAADYLRAVLSAAYQELRIMSDDSGSTKGALTCADIRHFRVPLPPLDEQERIVFWLLEKNEHFQKFINKAHHEITLLHEYRTRLISDVVTGKLDVRAAAERLPELPEDPAPEEEAAEEEIPEETDPEEPDMEEDHD